MADLREVDGLDLLDALAPLLGVVLAWSRELSKSGGEEDLEMWKVKKRDGREGSSNYKGSEVTFVRMGYGGMAVDGVDLK